MLQVATPSSTLKIHEEDPVTHHALTLHLTLSTLKGTLMRTSILTTVITLFLALACGQSFANTSFPEHFTDFEKMSFEQMKSLPDAKWPMAKKATTDDFKGKSETEVILLRNSIYAQHGFRFGQKSLANYFLGRSWYKAETADFGFPKLTDIEKQNVEMFVKHQASFKGGNRDVASQGDYYVSQVAFNLFSMGFCTYAVNGNPKAGLIVFDPGGVARVFHSQASQMAFAPYAYDGYLNPDTAKMGTDTLLINAKWNVRVARNMATVTLDFNPDDISRYRNGNGNPIIAPVTRQVLTADFSKPGQTYSFVKTKQCTMTQMK